MEIGLVSLLPALLLVRPGGMFASHEKVGLTVSLCLVVTGMLIRIWAGGCAGMHTGDLLIQAPRLTTGGPYSYVRNPIYLGTILLGIGMVGLIGDIRLLPLCIITFTVLYAMIVPAEERFLRASFGPEYENYIRAVPRLIPRLTRWNEGKQVNFQWGVLAGECRIAAVLLFAYFVMRLAMHFK
jgi:protein-S-isoprenylcysteine O-methyltransferase Ste14